MSTHQLDSLVTMSMLGSIGPTSRGTYASGILNFARFLLYRRARDRVPPDEPKNLMYWMLAFKNHDTAASYLSHVKLACDIARVGIEWFPPYCSRIIRSAKYGILNDEEAEAPPVFRRDLTLRMFNFFLADGWWAMAYLALFAYCFGRRAPSFTSGSQRR